MAHPYTPILRELEALERELAGITRKAKLAVDDAVNADDDFFGEAWRAAFGPSDDVGIELQRRRDGIVENLASFRGRVEQFRSRIRNPSWRHPNIENWWENTETYARECVELARGLYEDADDDALSVEELFTLIRELVIKGAETAGRVAGAVVGGVVNPIGPWLVVALLLFSEVKK